MTRPVFGTPVVAGCLPARVASCLGLSLVGVLVLAAGGSPLVAGPSGPVGSRGQTGSALPGLPIEPPTHCSVPVSDKLPLRLVRGDLEIATWGKPGNPIKEGCVIAVVRAPFETVVAILEAADRFAEFMPRVLVSKVEVLDEHTYLNHQRIALPFPVHDRYFTIRVVSGRDQDAMGHERWQSAWTLVEGSGNMVENRGSWTVLHWAKDLTLLRYGMLYDPGGAVPLWVVKRLGPATLERVATAMRRRSAEVELERRRVAEKRGEP